ncbi:hypothetical protein Patl1_37011 [Pistacia atlantica]|nr:hypothetical protein Patl1_37011 [Pistacia atlantica]
MNLTINQQHYHSSHFSSSTPHPTTITTTITASDHDPMHS